MIFEHADPFWLPLQELAEHAKVGGWYADLVDEFQRILSSREHRGDRAVARELAVTYGLWNDLSELFRKPGVCGFFTGMAGAC